MVNAFQRRRIPALLAIAVTILASGGCGPAPSKTCPNDVPAACPDGAPSYAAQVAPLLARRCGACHTAGGVSATHAFDSYEQVHAQRTGILVQLHACLMPPADQPQATADERQTIFAWLVCGAQNN